MSCFNNRSSSNIFDSCCNGNTLCHFDGNIDDLVTVPVYVQSVYDAVQFNLQGMRTIHNQTFSPEIPCGFTVSRIADIRARAFFNPCNAEDSRNLTVDMDTVLSGASFVQDCHGNPVEVVGPDGTFSQKILYSNNDRCDDECMGTQVFGTQNVSISGNVQVFIDLILCDHCNHETCFTVCAEVPIATAARPMTLTNFFEICMPASTDHAFLPRFTELTSVACEARLATNNCGRDLNINSDGQLSGNLLIALCVTAEKKVVAPVQMCVLSTGMAEVPTQNNSICSGFPTMFANGITRADTRAGCGCGCDDDNRRGGRNRGRDRDNDCGCSSDNDCDRNNDCGCSSDYDRDRDDDCGCGEPRCDSRIFR